MSSVTATRPQGTVQPASTGALRLWLGAVGLGLGPLVVAVFSGWSHFRPQHAPVDGLWLTAAVVVLALVIVGYVLHLRISGAGASRPASLNAAAALWLLLAVAGLTVAVTMFVRGSVLPDIALAMPVAVLLLLSSPRDLRLNR